MESKFFAVLADEASHVSNIEQMPIVLRFFDSNSEIREAFMGFVECDEGVTGEAVSTKILESVEKLFLDMRLCRGQGYDGARNMAGKCQGAAVRITRQYPKAPYVHCGAHALNLCVASACTIQVARNMMSHVRVVSGFFDASPKRFALLTTQIKDLLPNAYHYHLIHVCHTRWITRIDGLDVFAEIFVATVHCLDLIQSNVDRLWNTDSVRNTSGLFHATTSFQFIVSLMVVCRCLEATRALTKHLQSSTFDVVAANKQVTLLYISLRRLRKEKEICHSEWYEEAEYAQ